MATELDQLLRELDTHEDWIGLWWVIGTVYRFYPGAPSEEVRQKTLDLVQLMLSHGYIALRVVQKVQKYEMQAWEDQRPETVIPRIEREWTELGRDPTIGDIVWFGRSPG